MTLRSRLSAAWKAFKRDDFPPTDRSLALTEEQARTIASRALFENWRPSSAEVYPPVRLDLQPNTTYDVHAPVDMSPHPLPSTVDESKLTPDYAGDAITGVWYEDNFGNLWGATVKHGRVIPTGIPWSGISNVEVPAIIRKRRKKLVSVPKE